MKAMWRGTVFADSDDIVTSEGTAYFPAETVSWQYLHRSEKRTFCPWKGLALYYTAVIDDAIGPDVAWTYPHPWPWASELKGRVAFRPELMIDTLPQTDMRSPD